MQVKNQLMTDYLMPFKNINDFLKSIAIINKIYSTKTNNIDQVRDIIKHLLIIQLTNQEIKSFIQKITIYKDHYPLEAMANMELFNEEITKTSQTNLEHSIVLTSTATHCNYCKENTQDWYLLKSPIFTKTPMLYTINKIGKNKNYFQLN